MKKKEIIIAIGIIIIILVGYISMSLKSKETKVTETKENIHWYTIGDTSYSSPEHGAQIRYNGHEIWVTENVSTGEYVHYIERDNSKFFYDEDEISKNHSSFPVFSNGTDRIVVKGGAWNEGDSREKYIPPYIVNRSYKYEVLKVVFSPSFMIYYWNNDNNNTLKTLVADGDNVITTVRSDDMRLILVEEYIDNYQTIKYWQLRINREDR